MPPDPVNQWKTMLMVEIGPLDGDIPMHPGFLHEVVLRSGPELNEQLIRFNPPAPTQVTEEIVHVGYPCFGHNGI